MVDSQIQNLVALEVDPVSFENAIPNPYVIFNSVCFSKNVELKCDEVKYLLFVSSRPRMGLILGVRNQKIFSPFSAPYGGFSAVTGQPRIQEVMDAVTALKSYAVEKEYRGIEITLPPMIYDETFISKQVSAFLNHNFRQTAVDMNSSFLLSDFDANYLDSISYAAKKNYKTGVKNGLEFHVAGTDDEKLLCYSTIKINRESKNRPVRMSYDEVIATSKLIPADFFNVCYQGIGVASAIVFQVNPKIVQVIYWGGHPDHNGLRPTNFLSYNLWHYYKAKGFEIVDIGPSSQNGIPDCGLLDFKESLGCKLSMKCSFEWNSSST